LVAAFDEEDAVARTVISLRSLEGITEVVVVDDGSTDRTAQEAASAGARVVRAPANHGKGAALEGALARLEPADAYLLVDADVAESAAETAALLVPVLAGELDLAIGRLPNLPGGGFGLVKGMSARMISLVAGFRPEEPLSGQRAITREALFACRPLAHGFGVETAMTIDVLRLGFRVGEVPVDMRHRPTGRGPRGFIHRGRQGWDILGAGLVRVVGLR
jgi:hypothetical protein